MLTLLARLVRSLSRRYQVREARNGVEGLALLRERRPDAVMLDLIMPEMDGYELIREVRSDPELRQVPIIVLTARGDTNETMVARTFSITRAGGLSMRELTGCLTNGLEALESAGLASLARDSVAVPLGVPAG